MAKPRPKRRNSKKAAPQGESAEAALVAHGWTLYAHPLLLDQLDALAVQVSKAGKGSEAAKVLTWLTQALFDDIPRDPTLEVYRQGHTLGKGNTHWFRDKYAGRFRLFFRYNLEAKIIVYAWVNDEDSKRTYGSKNDAYAVFKKMLSNGNPPNSWEALLKEASTKAATERLKRKM